MCDKSYGFLLELSQATMGFFNLQVWFQNQVGMEKQRFDQNNYFDQEVETDL